MFRFLLTAIIVLAVLSGCSTRQVITDLDGSTAQRLVTHSIDQLMQKIPDEDFPHCQGLNVHVDPHFIKETALLSYASERFKAELGYRFQCNIVEAPSEADLTVTLFFTSLATEHDIFGLSIPFLVLPGYSEATDINFLAVEMFHGISEMYYYVSNKDGTIISRRDKTKASVRTDKFALPMLTIPVKTLN